MVEIEPVELREPDLTPELQLSYESIARRCARGVRGCATDEQYKELIERIISALAFLTGQTKPMFPKAPE